GFLEDDSTASESQLAAAHRDAGRSSTRRAIEVMTDELRIREFLEEILDSRCTPEEACAESPELLREVRERLERLRRVENQIDALFPSSNPAEPGDPHLRPRRPDAKLPQIDGYD